MTDTSSAPPTGATTEAEMPRVDTAKIQTSQPVADALVLFGATGDLAKRKLFPSLYRLERSGTLHVPVIGVARSDWTDDDVRDHAKESIEEHIPDADPVVIASLLQRLDLQHDHVHAPGDAKVGPRLGLGGGAGVEEGAWRSGAWPQGAWRYGV